MLLYPLTRFHLVLLAAIGFSVSCKGQREQMEARLDRAMRAEDVLQMLRDELAESGYLFRVKLKEPKTADEEPMVIVDVQGPESEESVATIDRQVRRILKREEFLPAEVRYCPPPPREDPGEEPRPWKTVRHG